MRKPRNDPFDLEKENLTEQQRGWWREWADKYPFPARILSRMPATRRILFDQGWDWDALHSEGHWAVIQSLFAFDPDRRSAVTGGPIAFSTFGHTKCVSLYWGLASPKGRGYKRASRHLGHRRFLRETDVTETRSSGDGTAPLQRLEDHRHPDPALLAERNEAPSFDALVRRLDPGGRVTEAERRVLRMVCVDGMTYRQAAERIGVTHQRIEQARKAGIAKLRELVRDRPELRDLWHRGDE